MTERAHNKLYWLLKIAGILISCALPIWSICEKFPVWNEVHGSSHSIGVGAVLILIVLLIIFRKTVFGIIHDKLNLKHAPPLAVWFVMLIISYVMVYLGSVMKDMTTVFWMGFIGCAVGTFFTYLAERYKKDVNEDE